MATVKNLLYLDEYKMYSVSSQLFGGLTEYLTSVEERSEAQNDQQSGPFWSGRMMADILRSRTSTEERKFLHDYSYTLFENELREQGKVLDATSTNFDHVADQLPETSFVAIRAKTVFNDMQAMQDILSRFNIIGGALAYMGAFASGTLESENDTELSKRQTQIREATINKILSDSAKAQGLYMDPKYLDNLGLLLNYAFEDNFEIQQEIGPYSVSAILRREYFREPPDLTVKKYSRFSAKELVLFGTVTQGLHSESPEILEKSAEDPEPPQDHANEDDQDLPFKEALMGMVRQLHELETTVAGKKHNEIILDPIALYREL